MPEEVLFKKEERMSSKEVSRYLRQIASKLETEEEITFKSGDQSTTIKAPNKPEFELKIERETSISNGKSELSLEIELEWDENGENDSKLEVE